MRSKRGILNPGAEGSTFHLSRHLPSPELAPFVERYWIVRWDLTGKPGYQQETLPYPCVNLTIEAGKTAVHGTSTRRFSVLLEGRGEVVGAKFKPGGFYPFLKRPLTELCDRVLSLEQIWADANAHQLEAAVLASQHDHEQLALLEGFLRARLPEIDPQARLAGRIVGMVLAERGIVSVEELAARSQLSARSLQRLFSKYVGVSPKWVIRRFRVHEAAERVAEGGEVDWARLGQELGYFDQAHFTKDFKAQVGRSPTEYAALCEQTRKDGKG